MPERKKSRKSRSSSDAARTGPRGGDAAQPRSSGALRILLAVIPVIIALSLPAIPDFGQFYLKDVAGVFLFGLGVGTFINIYWLRTSMRELEFYKRYYSETVMKPLKNDMELYKKHMAIILPFWAMAVLMLVIVAYVFAVFGLDMRYLLPLMLGVFDGMPISWLLMVKGKA
jgi:hypothetical protein